MSLYKNIKFYVGESGFRVARFFVDGVSSTTHDAFLCDALESDFQSTSSCEIYLEELKKIVIGAEKIAVWSGNAYEINANSSGVLFENLHTEEVGGHIPLHEFIFALDCWRVFLEKPSKEGLDEHVLESLDMVRAAVFD